MILTLRQKRSLCFQRERWLPLLFNADAGVRKQTLEIFRELATGEIAGLFVRLEPNERPELQNWVVQLLQCDTRPETVRKWLDLRYTGTRRQSRWAQEALALHEHPRHTDCFAFLSEDLWLELFEQLAPGEGRIYCLARLRHLRSRQGFRAALATMATAGAGQARHLRKALRGWQPAGSVYEWRKLVRAPQAHIRWNALCALSGYCPEPDLRPLLLVCLGDSDPRVRLAAVNTLAAWQESLPEFRCFLWEHLYTSDPQLGCAVLNAIGRLNWREASPFVQGLLEHPDVRRQLVTVKCLRRIHATDAAPRLLMLAGSQASPLPVRQQALLALRRLLPLGDYVQIKALINRFPELAPCAQAFRNQLYEWQQRLFQLERQARRKEDGHTAAQALQWPATPAGTSCYLQLAEELARQCNW